LLALPKVSHTVRIISTTMVAGITTIGIHTTIGVGHITTSTGMVMVGGKQFKQKLPYPKDEGNFYLWYRLS
jgi:hypothetical protein